MTDVKALEPGASVTWMHQPLGGYGYVQPVQARVVRLGKSRVLIEAPLRIGGSKQTWVKPSSLRPAEGDRP